MWDSFTPEDEAEMCAFSLVEHLGELDDRILNESEVVLHNLHWCTAIIFADGFEGLLFHGPTDGYIREILASVERFGAARCARISRKALEVFPDQSSLGRKQYRKRVYSALTSAARKRLTTLSHQFAAARDREINSRTILAYVTENRDRLRFSVVIDRKDDKFCLLCSDKNLRIKKR